MYDVMDVSRFIINYCNDKGYFINTSKLEKILYYVQALFIINENENEPCFDNDILAGEIGPFIPEWLIVLINILGFHLVMLQKKNSHISMLPILIPKSLLTRIYMIISCLKTKKKPLVLLGNYLSHFILCSSRRFLVNLIVNHKRKNRCRCVVGLGDVAVLLATPGWRIFLSTAGCPWLAILFLDLCII